MSKISISRYKPVGWRGESHRHYLAAKGIPSRYKHSYFAGLDSLRGNFSKSNTHALYQARWNEDMILAADAQIRSGTPVVNPSGEPITAKEMKTIQAAAEELREESLRNSARKRAVPEAPTSQFSSQFSGGLQPTAEAPPFEQAQTTFSEEVQEPVPTVSEPQQKIDAEDRVVQVVNGGGETRLTPGVPPIPPGIDFVGE